MSVMGLRPVRRTLFSCPWPGNNIMDAYGLRLPGRLLYWPVPQELVHLKWESLARHRVTSGVGSRLTMLCLGRDRATRFRIFLRITRGRAPQPARLARTPSDGSRS